MDQEEGAPGGNQTVRELLVAHKIKGKWLEQVLAALSEETIESGDEATDLVDVDRDGWLDVLKHSSIAFQKSVIISKFNKAVNQVMRSNARPEIDLKALKIDASAPLNVEARQKGKNEANNGNEHSDDVKTEKQQKDKKDKKNAKDAKDEKEQPDDGGDGEYRYVVGIDFGTSGTACAYAERGQNESDVKILKDWNEVLERGRRFAKPITSILLEPVAGKAGEYSCVAFGNEAHLRHADCDEKERENLLLFERFKMALYDSGDQKERGQVAINEQIATTNNTKIDASIVFVCALKHIVKKALEALRKDTGDDSITKEQIQWVLSCPAIWNEQAKQKMKEWMTEALGVDRPQEKGVFESEQIQIVLEPECASITLQRQLAMTPVGSKYILCDLGGGTADIVVHEKMEGNTVKEVSAPSGGPWGSAMINQRFEELLDEIFGPQFMRVFRTSRHGHEYQSILDEFEKQKCEFGMTSDELDILRRQRKFKLTQSVVIEMPRHFLEFAAQNRNRHYLKDRAKQYRFQGSKYLHDRAKQYRWHGKPQHVTVANRSLNLSFAVMCDLFEASVLNQLIAHVKGLIKQMKDMGVTGVDTIHLVGGLSESNYVQMVLEREFPSMKVRVPENPMLAVVNGAVHIALHKEFVQSRVMKFTYGVNCGMALSEARSHHRITDAHIRKHKVWNGFEKKYYVDDCFSVFVKKGQSVALDQAIRREYALIFSPNQRAVLTHVYASELGDPGMIKDEMTPIVESEFEIPAGYDLKNGRVITTFHFGGTMIRIEVELTNSDVHIESMTAEYKQ